MIDSSELEIWLDRSAQSSGEPQYSIQLRFHQAGTESDRMVAPAIVGLDLAALTSDSLKPEAYGARLCEIFAAEEIRREIDTARSVSESDGRPLRVRLFIGPGAPELHNLRWEALGDPRAPEEPLTTQQSIHFSRYLTSNDFRPVWIKPQRELTALVAIANPTDLDKYRNLAPVDTEGIKARIGAALGDIPTTYLAEQGKATLSNIAVALSGGVDIFYLVAHGGLIRGVPYLWLESPEGPTARTKGSDLIQRVRDMSEVPSVAVLASCQSAGTGDITAPGEEGGQKDWGLLAALGPGLSAAGIPSVLAMQGYISMETEATFMGCFIEQLRENGQVDSAMAVARGRVRERDDWWMPVLFTRLRNGRIWYQPGFGQSGDAEDKWPALVRHIKQSSSGGGGGDADAGGGGRRRRKRVRQEGGCTPIIGPGLLEPYIGRIQDMAARLAEQQGFPLSQHEMEQLAHIAQFLDTKVEHRFLHNDLERFLCGEVLRRFGSRLPEEMRKTAEEDPYLTDLLVHLGKARAEAGKVEGYKVLAELNLPIYITANQDNMLEALLEEQGKEPLTGICYWNDDLVHDPEPVFEPLGDTRPTPDKPLVYHMFGHLDDPNSLVLSEDDHFDFLTGFARNKEHVPGVVRAALATTALLFVGFKLEDWSFRVLFRALRSGEGTAISDRLSHMAAQVEPDEGRLIDAEGTRRYLGKKLGSANISVFWGDAESFLTALVRELKGEG